MPKRSLPKSAVIDGKPHRAVTSVNLRFEDKRKFDLMHAWWSLEQGVPLTQWDAVSILMAAALENPRLSLPADLRA